jgi:hypothetical protein
MLNSQLVLGIHVPLKKQHMKSFIHAPKSEFGGGVLLSFVKSPTAEYYVCIFSTMPSFNIMIILDYGLDYNNPF